MFLGILNWPQGAEKEYSRCDICFECVDGEVQKRSEDVALCLCGSKESR